MKCPKCGKEMVIGTVESNREIFWKSEHEKPLRVSSKLFMTSKAKAHRCADCGLVVLEEDQEMMC